jgi:hypothetical protein
VSKAPTNWQPDVSGNAGREGQESVMAKARQQVSTSTGNRAADALAQDVGELMRALKALVDPYRPELHYMRGPGPKWRAKYDQAPAAVDGRALAALVRVKAR